VMKKYKVLLIILEMKYLTQNIILKR
jgi:hypothetical protein